ncbi:Uncharacterized protein YjbI, contains pentapeptide repeats [Aliiroseovarius crassostreae]|uniref:Low-complexity protein n=2 Tax=Aliiroseovarius crassostreae TaxID=154981 RepID=A0A0P7JPU4_9RHOB|nr:hypothetical protein AKJ29_11840 [Aliiroseovarius crassostreae]SFU42270.1 Uncharacterized protein YjbI, contains pentapeptide repeats [Aliiroseovarius crassostreae]
MVFCGGAFNLGLFMLDFWQALTTHPMTPWFGWLGLGTILIFAALGQVRPYIPEDPIEKLQKTLGATNLPYSLFLFLLLFWATIALLLFTGLLSVIWQVIAAMLPAAPDTAEGKAAQWEYRLLLTKLAALTTVLGATIALPFTIIRLRLTNEQTRHAENVLFNTKLNEAVESLHARYQATEWKRKDGYVDIWKDDIIKRNGAIDRLENLAIERPEEAPRIARILCVYLKEMSKEHPPETPPKGTAPDELIRWARGLKIKRADMQAALHALARIHQETKIPPKELGIDLYKVNLQAMTFKQPRFNAPNFEHAVLSDSYLDGANLIGTKLNRATLNRASLIGAKLDWAELENAELNGAKIVGAQLSEANLTQAKLQFAELGYTSCFNTYFNGAVLNGTILTGVKTNGASFRNVDLSMLMNVDELIEHAFGDRSVILPDDVPFPIDRWPDAKLDNEAYWQEYRRFLSDPGPYIPPQHRND